MGSILPSGINDSTKLGRPIAGLASLITSRTNMSAFGLGVPKTRGSGLSYVLTRRTTNALMDPLTASSYLHPSGGEEYAPFRKAVVAQATAMGYDVPTMTEHGVAWADDQDPFGHVGGATYPRLVFKANFRVFESFSKTLGDKYDDLYRAKGVGILIRSYMMDLRRQVTYPDCLLTAARISEVYPDRYFSTTSIWSYRQQTIVAESSGYVVFFDYRKGKVANLIEYGGVYADLHRDLMERCKRSNELHAQWVAQYPTSENKAKL